MKTVRQGSRYLLIVRYLFILVVALPLVNIGLAQFKNNFNLTTSTLILLILTMTIAIFSPVWMTVVSAIENFVFLNYLFTPPFHTLRISNRDDLIALLIYLGVSISASLILRKLKLRTARLQQLSAEGLFLSNLASDIIRGHNSIEEILKNSQTTFGLSNLVIIRKITQPTKVDHEVMYGRLEKLDRELLTSQIELNSEYSLIAEPPIHDEALRNLVTTFGSQILILLEREIFESNEKALSDIRQTDQMRVALLNAVSHDLRGPLASSKAAISSLKNNDVDWTKLDQQDLLESASNSIDQLTHLIENLLDMSRLESDSIALNWRNLGVEDLVSAAITYLKPEPDSIQIEIDPDLSPIHGDPILIERVLSNLLENALRHISGKLPVAISAHEVGQTIEIRIIDHGKGIGPRDRTKVFIPFQRLGDRDNSTGVGLGLAIVKGFTELMSGAIKLEETPGGGLSAVVSFPIGEDEHSSVMAESHD